MEHPFNEWARGRQQQRHAQAHHQCDSDQGALYGLLVMPGLGKGNHAGASGRESKAGEKHHCFNHGDDKGVNAVLSWPEKAGIQNASSEGQDNQTYVGTVQQQRLAHSLTRQERAQKATGFRPGADGIHQCAFRINVGHMSPSICHLLRACLRERHYCKSLLTVHRVYWKTDWPPAGSSVANCRTATCQGR